METNLVAQILTSGLKQNLHHKRSFILSQVRMESQKNIQMNA